MKIQVESVKEVEGGKRNWIHRRTSFPHPQVMANRYRPQGKPVVAKAILSRSEPSQGVSIILLHFLLFQDDYLD